MHSWRRRKWSTAHSWSAPVSVDNQKQHECTSCAQSSTKHPKLCTPPTQNLSKSYIKKPTTKVLTLRLLQRVKSQIIVTFSAELTVFLPYLSDMFPQREELIIIPINTAWVTEEKTRLMPLFLGCINLNLHNIIKLQGKTTEMWNVHINTDFITFILFLTSAIMLKSCFNVSFLPSELMNQTV